MLFWPERVEGSKRSVRAHTDSGHGFSWYACFAHSEPASQMYGNHFIRPAIQTQHHGLLARRRIADSAVQACKVTSSPGQSCRRPAALRATSKAGGLLGCRLRCTGRNGNYSCLYACCTFLTCGGGECAVYPSRSSQAGEFAQLSSHRAAAAGRR